MAIGTIRYWAAARAAAGTAEETYDASTLAEALDAVRASHGPQFTRVLTACSFLVQGVRAAPATPLSDGDVIEVLPPFAGG